MNLNNMARVNKQVRMDSSRYMMMRRSGTVSKQVGQSAMPQNLGQAGGPGDLISAIQKNCQTTSKGNPNEWKKVTYRVPTVKARTAYRGQSGVDKKHGSYARFLARRVGGVLRKEKMPRVIANTAVIKQPRNRTGTNSGARAESRISTKVNYCLNDNARGMQGFRLLGGGKAYSGFRDKVTTYNKTKNPYEPGPNKKCLGAVDVGNSLCFNKNCYDNRIPGNKILGNQGQTTYTTTTNSNGKLCYNDCKIFTGRLGNNTQCHGGRCGCCVKTGFKNGKQQFA